MLRTTIIALSLLGLSAAEATADEITLQGETFNFRDQRSDNSVGFAIGDRNTFGIDGVLPNGDDSPFDGFADNPGPPTLPTAGVAKQGNTEANLFFFPTDLSPNQFVVSAAFDASRTGSWDLTFTNGSDTATTTTPVLSDQSIVPFVTSFSLSGSGTTPTFNWTIPTDSTHTAQTIRIFDLEKVLNLAGTAPIILSRFLPDPQTTNFQVPAGELLPDHLYSVSVQLDEFQGGFSSGTLRSRSRSFFDFSTGNIVIPGDEPVEVFLPSSNPDQNPTGAPIYKFNISGITEGQTIFIDPLLTTGYDYAIGAGDPFFASVVLPDIGDGIFDLFLFDENNLAFDTGIDLLADIVFDFTTGLTNFGIGLEGIDAFRILGIELAAGIDPFDATAFATGLTFVADGQFTGTMTPLVVSVPEPDSLYLFGFGALLLLAWPAFRESCRISRNRPY